ncbi:MAG: tripartite tricarboxylate transporter substrate-binding protein [Gammaproteobacteria bacterium]|nr:tripartite tricarboxylate transporter substrate-binding protein [Gammaproteobacteria bacterium]
MPTRTWARFAPWLAIAACSATASERLHVVIPAGPGGGLDGTARAVGRALVELDLVERVSFENVSGGGGGRAMAYFLDNADRFETPLLVNSTPLLVRSLQGLFPYSFRDLTPVAGVVADYGVLAVRADDPRTTWEAVAAELRRDPRAFAVGGGSARGSLDHIVLAMALRLVEVDPRAVRYLPYDGGGKAMLALLGGEVDVLSSGLGETMAFIEAGEVRVLAVTAPERVGAIAEAPTFKELGYPLVFANWRGLFGPPGMPAETLAGHLHRLANMKESAHWQATLERRGWASLNAEGASFVAYLEAQERQLKEVMIDIGFVRPDE